MLRSPRSLALVTMTMMLMAIAATIAPAANRSSKDPAEPRGPEVHLTVSTHHGFRPLTFTLTGHLSGVDPTDEQFCHVGVEWESRTPSGLTVSSKEDPKCLHPPEQIDVQTAFTKVVTLSTPGTYVYRLILHRRDGDRVLSNTQEVTVLDNQ